MDRTTIERIVESEKKQASEKIQGKLEKKREGKEKKKKKEAELRNPIVRKNYGKESQTPNGDIIASTSRD